MPTRRCHLERLAATCQAPNDGQVGDEVVLEIIARSPLRLTWRRGPLFLALQGGSDLRQRCGWQDTHPAHERGLWRVLRWEQNGRRTGVAQGVDHCQDSRYGP
jgi:hypothetical protein